MFVKLNLFCNFASMKDTLPEIIKKNDNLRRLLLTQEGGIMKYLAEHLDANGTARLFSDYQELCAEIFFERNKWDLNKVWEGENMRKAALGYEHLSKEVQYQTALKCALSEMPSEVVEIVEDFNEQYLTYAYNQNRKRWYPNGMTPQDIYRETIGLYRGNGFAWRCMNIILKEYHAKGHVVKTTSGIYTEFQIRQYVKQLTHGIFSQLRQAVAEMLEGKTNEQCRQMAISTLRFVRAFSQMIYCDEMVAHSRDVGLYDYANQREVDGKWLQEVADNAMFKEFAAKVKNHSMQFYFAYFISLLKDLGRIWAAQLLVRGIDMQDLEKEECCILQPSDSHLYYIDKYYTDDLPTQFCVADNYQADSLLKGMGRERNIESDDEVVDKKENENILDEKATPGNGIKQVVTDFESVSNEMENVSSPWNDSLDSIFDEKVNPQEIFKALKSNIPDKKLLGRPQHYVSFRILKILEYVKFNTTEKDYLKWINLHFNRGWSNDDALKFRINNKSEFDKFHPSKWKSIDTKSKINESYYNYAIDLKNAFTQTIENGNRVDDSDSFEHLKDRPRFLSNAYEVDNDKYFVKDEDYINNGK